MKFVRKLYVPKKKGPKSLLIHESLTDDDIIVLSELQ